MFVKSQIPIHRPVAIELFHISPDHFETSDSKGGPPNRFVKSTRFLRRWEALYRSLRMQDAEAKNVLEGSKVGLNFVLQLPYQWSYEYNNRAAMKKPTFSIQTRGVLPTKDSSFQVRLDCTGEVTAEVKVLLFLNVSAVSHRHNETFLTFRRSKICLKRTDGQTGECRLHNYLPRNKFVSHYTLFLCTRQKM